MYNLNNSQSMKYLNIILIFVFCLTISYKYSFGINAKKTKILCSPTKTVRTAEKPITYDLAYIDNNTLRNAGKFENPYLHKILIRGKIKDERCIPIPNALIEIWQEDEYGKKRYNKYAYSFLDRYELNQEQYSNFLGIASATSDNNGNFSFITVIPQKKIKNIKKQSLINIAILHKDFPQLESQILLNPKFPISRSNKRILAFKNIVAQKFYHLPTYDFDIILNGTNKYKTF